MITNVLRTALLRDLPGNRIAKRQQGKGGRQLSYLEAWDVRRTLIRMFDFGGFSTEVITCDLAYEDAPTEARKNWDVGYRVTLRLTVFNIGPFDQDAIYTEVAVGNAHLPDRGEAHDMAVKTAESDALKRAAVNLGTQFGLSLYNDGQTKDVVIKTAAMVKDEEPAVEDAQVQPEPAEGIYDGRNPVADQVDDGVDVTDQVPPYVLDSAVADTAIGGPSPSVSDLIDDWMVRIASARLLKGKVPRMRMLTEVGTEMASHSARPWLAPSGKTLGIILDAAMRGEDA